MDNIAGSRSSLSIVTHLTVAALVIIWLVPTIGLLVSSFRDRDQINTSGWWQAFSAIEQTFRVTAATDDVTPEGDSWVIRGNVFTGPGSTETFGGAQGEVRAFGDSGFRPTEYPAGQTADLGDGEALTVQANGDFEFVVTEAPGERGPRIYIGAEMPPDWTLANYDTVMAADGMDVAFINTLTVAIPATVIPILFAAFAAYALAWMDFPGRGLLIAAVVGLLVVPLQIALVPLLRLHEQVGIGQSFLGIWFAHTGYGLPLAIYLLRNYMVGLPRDIIECARVDGATDFQIFTKIILPLSFPALASFAIFQFLWTWNDLLVAKVFLPSTDDAKVMTVKIADDLLGSRGGDWGILAAAAFVSIAVPLLVFFTMQRYLVRGLLAGSVK